MILPLLFPGGLVGGRGGSSGPMVRRCMVVQMSWRQCRGVGFVGSVRAFVLAAAAATADFCSPSRTSRHPHTRALRRSAILRFSLSSITTPLAVADGQL
jgi:hypothetical protein